MIDEAAQEGVQAFMEKRISSERYMQMHATKAQLDAGAPFSKDGFCLQIVSFSLLVLAGFQRTGT